jgi:hypothetical protein
VRLHPRILPADFRLRHPPYVPLRQETATSHVVLSVTLAKAKATQGHSSDFVVERVLKGGPKFAAGGVFRRSIVRYALQCPQEQARRFVAAARKADPEFVEDVEELLGLEAPPAANRPGER